MKVLKFFALNDWRTAAIAISLVIFGVAIAMSVIN